MSRPVWVLGVLAVGLLPFAGCGKSGSAAAPTGEVLVIDATHFRPAFATAAPEIKAVVDEVMAKIQDTAYPDALAGLDQLAHTPNLTDLQKKVVASLTEQIKKKQAAAR